MSALFEMLAGFPYSKVAAAMRRTIGDLVKVSLQLSDLAVLVCQLGLAVLQLTLPQLQLLACALDVLLQGHYFRVLHMPAGSVPLPP